MNQGQNYQKPVRLKDFRSITIATREHRQLEYSFHCVVPYIKHKTNNDRRCSLLSTDLNQLTGSRRE